MLNSRGHWRDLEPIDTRPRKCTACKTWVRYPDALMACGKHSGPMGVRLCGECCGAEWALSTSADDSPNMRKCRACGEHKAWTSRVDGWNSLCAVCIADVGGSTAPPSAAG